MNIKKIKINSYGKIKEKEIKLENNINIIYGENESGKSTILNFISNIFYGISKNKKGKDLSDYEKYKPWDTEEFSGKIEYELDNKNKFEIYRDFNKKNPVIFNEKMEEISKQFNIDKIKGNEFFYEQIKIDEELFLSSFLVNQDEVKLNGANQNMLIQKISNLVGTGEDNVSYKIAVDRLNRRQLEEVGTERTRGKPINIITNKIEELEKQKIELEKYIELKYEIEESKNNILEEINKLEIQKNILKEIEKINNENKLEEEKIKIKENIVQENNEKIKIIENKISQIKIANKNKLEENNKKINNKKTNNKNKINLIIFFILIILNILQFVFIKNIYFNSICFLTVPTFLILLFFKNNKLKNNKKIEEKNTEEIKFEINKLENEISFIEKNNIEIEKEINKIKINNNLKINLEKEKIKNKYSSKIEENKINILINKKQKDFEIENIQNSINQKKIENNSLDLRKENIEIKLENLANVEENLINHKEEYVNLKNTEKSLELTKKILEIAYEKMKDMVTPKFTKQLSKNISNITDKRYTRAMYNEEKGLIVELKNGNYVPVNRLSIGTIDQLYLSLRLSMIDDLSEEKLPIILDESFAYYDNNRLKNILKYLSEEFNKRQIIIFTCTIREKEILKELNIENNYIEI